VHISDLSPGRGCLSLIAERDILGLHLVSSDLATASMCNPISERCVFQRSIVTRRGRYPQGGVTLRSRQDNCPPGISLQTQSAKGANRRLCPDSFTTKTSSKHVCIHFPGPISFPRSTPHLQVAATRLARAVTSTGRALQKQSAPVISD
jgi:hypothetical protein